MTTLNDTDNQIKEIQPQTELKESSDIDDSNISSSNDDISNLIYIILQNKDDYYTNFPNKTIWEKNMKSYVYSYLKDNTVTPKDLVQVPKYLIDAPFETPNTLSDNNDYNEDNYEIIIEDDDYISTSNTIIDDSPNHYIIRIHKISDFVLNNELEEQAFSDFEACEQNNNDSLSTISKFCTKLVLLSYLGAYGLLFISLFTKDTTIYVQTTNSTITIDEL